MLTSKARRRLAQKTSALGLTGTLVLLAGSTLALPAPASAAVVADKTMEVTYDCTGGTALTSGQVKATVSVQDSVEPGKMATVTWKFTALKAARQLTAGQVTSAGGDLTVSGGGTPTPLKGTGTGSLTAAIPPQGDFTPPNMTATLTAPSTAGSVTLMPVTTATPAPLTIKAGTTAADTSTCTYVSVTPTTGISVDVKVGGGGGTGTDTITYECTITGTGTNPVESQVDIQVTPTMPTGARANQDASITWKGVVQSTGDPLPAPTTGFPSGTKIFATVKGSGAGVPTTPATGEAAFTSTAGQAITTLPSVTIKMKPTTTGTVTITPGDLAFGTSTTSQTVKCLAPTTGLTPYTFTVSAATSTPTNSNTPTTSNTPTPTKTKTEFVTETPTTRKSPTTRSSQTPKKGAATGAGGDAGPDGRMFLLAGSVLVLGAGAGGLMLRRRNVARG